MRIRRMLFGLLALGVLVPAGAAIATTYTIDPAHTSVSFKVRHLFTHVQGRFDEFQGTIQFDSAKPKETKIEGSIDAASINTNNEKRDNHLRSSDFFHVEEHPKITFASTGVKDIAADGKSGVLLGTLRIHGVEKPVEIQAEFLGEAQDPWGNRRAGFRGTTKINRKDFGLDWNEVLEAGGVLVGNEVEIEINAEAMPEQ